MVFGFPLLDPNRCTSYWNTDNSQHRKMNLATVIPTVIASTVLGLGGGYIAMYVNLERLEVRQQEIKQDVDETRQDVKDIREGIEELNRFLRDRL